MINRQCEECGGYELDNGVDDLCYCEEEDELDPEDEFDKWVAAKPSYYTEEHRQSFIAGWKAARGEK